jgi:hypothetical protein
MLIYLKVIARREENIPSGGKRGRRYARAAGVGGTSGVWGCWLVMRRRHYGCSCELWVVRLMSGDGGEGEKKRGIKDGWMGGWMMRCDGGL